MAKWISVILVIAVVITAVGCGKKAARESNPTAIPTATLAAPIGETGTLSGLEGDVQVLRQSSSGWIAAISGMKIGTGDSLKTGSDGYVLITFFDGSVMEVEAESEISVAELSVASGTGSTTIRINQAIGNTINRVENIIDSSSTYEVETPAGSGVVRGTIFLVVVTGNGRYVTISTFDEGDEEEHYVILNNNGVMVNIPEGMTSTCEEGGVPGNPFYTNPGNGHSASGGGGEGNGQSGGRPTSTPTPTLEPTPTPTLEPTPTPTLEPTPTPTLEPTPTPTLEPTPTPTLEPTPTPTLEPTPTPTHRRAFMATISPDTAYMLETKVYTMTCTADSNNANRIGSVTAEIPFGFIEVTILNVTASPERLWSGRIEFNKIRLKAANGGNELTAGEYVAVTFSAIAPYWAGSYEWTVWGREGRGWAGDLYILLGTQPTVTVIADHELPPMPPHALGDT